MGLSHADTGSLAANSSEGKVEKEQERTVISTALQGTGIYTAGALYYFIHRYDFFCSFLSRKNMKLQMHLLRNLVL